MNANRRSQERKRPERMVFCKLGGEENGSVLDLTEDGLRFESLTPIKEKDLLQLRLSVDVDSVNSAVEATGKLAWIDSAKRTGGLRFLDLTAPAREQIRAWLSETSTSSSGAKRRASARKRDKPADDGSAIEKPAILEEARVPSLQLLSTERQREEIGALGTQLVPVEQYRKQTRVQFLRGVLVGFGICAVVMIPIFLRYSGDTKSGSAASTTGNTNRAAQSSEEQTRASVAQPGARSSSSWEPGAAKPLATKPTAAQTASAAAPTWPRPKQSPQTTEASSTGLMMRASSPSAQHPATPRPAIPQAAKVQRPLGASPAVATAPAVSNAHPSLRQAPPTKKGSATVQQLWSALQAGDMNAAVALADLYARGEGVPVNCQQARVLLLAAAEKNNAEASKKLQQLNKGGCPANKE